MKNKFLSIALSSALVAMLLVPSTFANETTDVDVTVADGDLELSLAGDWNGTITVNEGTLTAGTAGTVTWTSDGEMTDYMLVKDFDTAADGFEITISAGDLTDDGGVEDALETSDSNSTGLSLQYAASGNPTPVEVATGATARTEEIAINLDKSGSCAKTSELTYDSGFDSAGSVFLEGSQDLIDGSAVFTCTSQTYISPYQVEVTSTDDTAEAAYSATITLGVNETRT